jgi:hypothetical protein
MNSSPRWIIPLAIVFILSEFSIGVWFGSPRNYAGAVKKGGYV